MCRLKKPQVLQSSMLAPFSYSLVAVIQDQGLSYRSSGSFSKSQKYHSLQSAHKTVTHIAF